MLEYFKDILTRVSFDAGIFEKELRKALRSLLAWEISEFRAWCYARFTGLHGEILDRCFAPI